MDEDVNEAFLNANANPEFIAARFAEVLRNLIRAIAATDPHRPIAHAAKEMTFVGDLLRRCESPISWYSLFAEAVEDIRKLLPKDPDDRQYIRAAQNGMKYLVESSCADNAAAGRAQRRLHEFLRMIDYSRATPRS